MIGNGELSVRQDTKLQLIVGLEMNSTDANIHFVTVAGVGAGREGTGAGAGAGTRTRARRITGVSIILKAVQGIIRNNGVAYYKPQVFPLGVASSHAQRDEIRNRILVVLDWVGKLQSTVGPPKPLLSASTNERISDTNSTIRIGDKELPRRMFARKKSQFDASTCARITKFIIVFANKGRLDSHSTRPDKLGEMTEIMKLGLYQHVGEIIVRDDGRVAVVVEMIGSSFRIHEQVPVDPSLCIVQ
jgi:hypothetical protein